MTSEPIPLDQLSNIHLNSTAAELVEFGLFRKEAKLSSAGALVVETGEHTGRSAQDKFIVRDATTDHTVWWSDNREMTETQFENLLEDFKSHAHTTDVFVQDLFAGAEPDYRLKARIICEKAWHALFIQHLLRQPSPSGQASFTPDLTVVNFPQFRADPSRHGCRSETVIACNFTKKVVLIGGSLYAGETKKSVFSFLNYIMPDMGVMPMHCSANVGMQDESAIFFGLSGTGKTTLSATTDRTLLGDDEHGWSPHGVFNFEGGCYAKTIRLSREAEPEIWAASNRFGTILENVIVDSKTREPDFDNGRLTENTRSAYPLSYISNASKSGTAGHPKNIVMLCADAFGVLPPISRLSPSQAMYHFLSGYTAKVAGTEKGIGKEPSATFSTCFGAPFMPRHPSVYGNMLRELISKHDVTCWLVNTGWTGGRYGVGQRMPISITRALLQSALSGELSAQPMRRDPHFGFEVPLGLPGFDGAILNPRVTWSNSADYDAQAKALIDMFKSNFEKFEPHVDADVRAAAPMLQEAAE